jgi:hypothetical protein
MLHQKGFLSANSLILSQAGKNNADPDNKPAMVFEIPVD